MKIEKFIIDDMKSVLKSMETDSGIYKNSENETEYFDKVQTNIELIAGMFSIVSINEISDILFKLKEFISSSGGSSKKMSKEIHCLINSTIKLLSELLQEDKIGIGQIESFNTNFTGYLKEIGLIDLFPANNASEEKNFEKEIENNESKSKEKSKNDASEKNTDNLSPNENDLKIGRISESLNSIEEEKNMENYNNNPKENAPSLANNNNNGSATPMQINSKPAVKLTESKLPAAKVSSEKFSKENIPAPNMPKYKKGEFVLNIIECFSNMSQDVLSIFIEEAQEIIANLDNRLIELEKDSGNIELLNLIFRDMHTLKGNSATINFKAMNFIAHRAENTLDKIRKRTLSLTSSITDTMLECVDAFKEMMDNIINNKSENMDLTDLIYKLDLCNIGISIEQVGLAKNKTSKNEGKTANEQNRTAEQNLKSSENTNVSEPSNSAESQSPAQAPSKPQSVSESVPSQIINSIDKSAAQSQTAAAVTASSTPKKIETTSLRVDIQKLNTAMNLIGEIVIDKIRLNQKIKKISDINILINEIIGLIEGDNDIEFEENFKIEITDKINNYVNSLNIDADIYRLFSKEIKLIKSTVDKLKKEQIDLETFSKKIDKENIVADLRRVEQIFKESVQELLFIVEHLSLVTNDLQESIMKMRMVPVSQLFDKVPRIIRTVTKDLGKKVELEVIGAETELDKTVIEQLNDPLTHIIRNSVDHGIEKPDDRIKKGKPETGTVSLKAEHKGNQVEIVISDDGKGINAPVIVKKALENGLITQEKAATMTKSEILELIFLPGLSSAEKVTEISGRGVGMDVVLSNIKKLKGTIEIESEIDMGTKITIRLPLTMAIMQVQLIKCSNQIFAIPINFIEEIINIKKDRIMKIGPKRVFNLRDEIIPIVELNEILELRAIDYIEKEFYQIAIINISDKRIGFIIDGLIVQQEIVIKSLGNVLKNVKHVTGATILGEGNVILILDILGVYATAKKMVDISSPQPLSVLNKRNANLNLSQKNPALDNKKRILIIDDSSTMRASLKEHLEEAGYATVQAKDGFEALDKLKSESIDLFTVDINMPGMNGYDLTKKIRELPDYIKKPVIMVSSKSDKIDKMRGLDAGADEYITKPYDKNNLLQLIKKFID